MQQGIILSQQDIKKIIAEHFNVSEDKVIASKFSFIVVQEPDTPKELEPSEQPASNAK